MYVSNRVVHIMGEMWVVKFLTEEEDPRLSDRLGLCDTSCREIVIAKELSGDSKNLTAIHKKIVRHEIIHAFLFECGLDHGSHSPVAWGVDEEITDWFALNGGKIYLVWKELGVEK